MSDDREEDGLTFVGAPMDVVRAVDLRFLDQARLNFADYVTRTLLANMACGGRYNAPCSFGALYCANDEGTAWAELAARFAREGIPGLPPSMGLLRIQIRDGRYADLTDGDVAALWECDRDALTATTPTTEQLDRCRSIGASVRSVGDFLVAPSARAEGENIALFPHREHTGLMWELIGARASAVPDAYVQHPTEAW